MESGFEEGASGAADEDDVLRGIRALQGLIWAHPVAFQRAFSALVHEGREFARTPEGAELRGSLERSELVGRARMIWDVLSMSAFSDDREELLPSVFIDLMAKAAASMDLERLLAQVFSERIG
jgi:hypothetical protein